MDILMKICMEDTKVVQLKKRANAGATECDAASCYDKMIVGPTSIVETSAGTLEELRASKSWHKSGCMRLTSKVEF
eukprot:12081060-Ditylum_brightwellii.AAC.1